MEMMATTMPTMIFNITHSIEYKLDESQKNFIRDLIGIINKNASVEFHLPIDPSRSKEEVQKAFKRVVTSKLRPILRELEEVEKSIIAYNKTIGIRNTLLSNI